MSDKNIFNIETLVEAIKEVAAVISENGGADIRAIAKQINENEIAARIIIEPHQFISDKERERRSRNE